MLAFRLAAALAAVSALAAPSATAAVTPDAGATTHIIGGEKVDDPSVVQLTFGCKTSAFTCTGEVISSEWVLTAKHCIQMGASPLRATAITSSRNSWGWGLGMKCILSPGPHGPEMSVSTKPGAVPL